MMRIMAVLMVFLVYSCRENKDEAPALQTIYQPSETNEKRMSEIEKHMINAGLVNVQERIPPVLCELRYSTTNNFLHTDLYGDLERAYLQPDVADKLFLAYEFLQAEDSTLTFLIYDAARPLSVQQKMWDMVDIPVSERSNYISNPALGSIHNYGAAIDITLCDRNGAVLDMGTPYDYFGELAQPILENMYLRNGELTLDQINNRRLLRSVMQKAGFRQLPKEWWHYNSCSRETAKARYKIIE